MNFNLTRTSTLALGLGFGLFASAGALAQNTERKVLVQPHVLDAKVSGLCAPRDAATGQSSGRSSDYLMQLDEKKRLASAPVCDSGSASTSPQEVRESPTLAKTTSVDSWSVGCTSPSMATQPGSSTEARAGYDLKTAKAARTASSTSTCTSPDGAPAGQAVRESLSKASLGRTKELTGHVTLMK